MTRCGECRRILWPWQWGDSAGKSWLDSAPACNDPAECRGRVKANWRLKE